MFRLKRGEGAGVGKRGRLESEREGELKRDEDGIQWGKGEMSTIGERREMGTESSGGKGLHISTIKKLPVRRPCACT